MWVSFFDASSEWSAEWNCWLQHGQSRMQSGRQPGSEERRGSEAGDVERGSRAYQSPVARLLCSCEQLVLVLLATRATPNTFHQVFGTGADLLLPHYFFISSFVFFVFTSATATSSSSACGKLMQSLPYENEPREAATT